MLVVQGKAKRFKSYYSILNENVSVNFALEEDNLRLSFYNKFNFKLNNAHNVCTTKSRNTIDAIFNRYLDI